MTLQDQHNLHFEMKEKMVLKETGNDLLKTTGQTGSRIRTANQTQICLILNPGACENSKSLLNLKPI